MANCFFSYWEKEEGQEGAHSSIPNFITSLKHSKLVSFLASKHDFYQKLGSSIHFDGPDQETHWQKIYLGGSLKITCEGRTGKCTVYDLLLVTWNLNDQNLLGTIFWGTFFVS